MNSKLFFRREKSKHARLAASCSAFFMLAAILVLAIAFVASGEIGGVWFMLFLFCVWGYVAMFSLLATCDIALSDDGISTHAFGRTWQRMAWNDIIRIRINTRPDVETSWLAPPKIAFYQVYSSDKRLLTWIVGPICFSERIEGVRELLNIINGSVAGRGVAILDERAEGEPVRLARL